MEKKNNEKALLVISFGTSHMDTRKKTIEVCERKLMDAFLNMIFLGHGHPR